MHIPIHAIRIAQTHLRDTGFDPGPIDGILGPGTEAALEGALAARRNDLAAAHAAAILSGSRKRKLTAYIQLLAQDRGIDTGAIDGFWGPQTDFAFDALEHAEEHGNPPEPWRDPRPPVPNPNQWPLEREADLMAFYGQPGTHLTMIQLPYTHRLSWDLSTRVNRMSCHEKVADSIVRVLNKVLAHYGQNRLVELRLERFGGCFNKRKKRGGTEWSTHAWGMALDYDPDQNRLQWGRDRAVFARPEYEAWWGFWEEEGWVSLGRAANFDWMHVQAARRG